MSGYIAEWLNRWTAVNGLDAGKLVQLAIDKATPGSVLHAVADAGIAAREIATAREQFLNVPVESIPADRAAGGPWLAGVRRMTLTQDIAAGHHPGTEVPDRQARVAPVSPG